MSEVAVDRPYTAGSTAPKHTSSMLKVEGRPLHEKSWDLRGSVFLYPLEEGVQLNGIVDFPTREISPPYAPGTVGTQRKPDGAQKKGRRDTCEGIRRAR